MRHTLILIKREQILLDTILRLALKPASVTNFKHEFLRSRLRKILYSLLTKLLLQHIARYKTYSTLCNGKRVTKNLLIYDIKQTQLNSPKFIQVYSNAYSEYKRDRCRKVNGGPITGMRLIILAYNEMTKCQPQEKSVILRICTFVSNYFHLGMHTIQL